MTRDPPKPERVLAKRNQIRNDFQTSMAKLETLLRPRPNKSAPLKLARAQVDIQAAMARHNMEFEDVLNLFAHKFTLKGRVGYDRSVRLR